MPAKIMLKITEGKLAGQEFSFDEHTSCIIGRAADCSPKIPNDEEHQVISRHHCLLDINPPDIRVRDFGSLNGTVVNGVKIGQREKGMTPEQGQKMEFPEHDLRDGDEIRLVETVFRVGIYVPAVCEECRKEIPEEGRAKAERTPGVYQCGECRRKAEQAGRKQPPKKKPKVCARCGRDVSSEVGENRQGDYVCSSCRSDSLQMLMFILGMARSGGKDLFAIQGYTFIKKLGVGGRGAVCLARHDRTGEEVALKVMLPKVAADERARNEFLREIENTRALKHPNVVQLYESGCSNGIFFFTMEYCDGGSVDKLMAARGGKLSIEEASGIVLQALDGLEYAHNAEVPHVELADGSVVGARGVVHRDLSPQNLYLRGTGKSRIAKVADFGLSKAFDKAGLSGHTRTGEAAGKPWFMPRQQVVDYKRARPNVDVWAMAASLYNMLTGVFPRDFPSGIDPWQVALEQDPVAIRKRDRSIPKKLAEVIDLALVDDPKIHFESAAQFKRALEGAL